MSIPSVLAVGSCRVYQPLRELHKRGIIKLLNFDRNWWFTHSPGEALQYVNILAGTVEVADHLRPLVFETSLDLPVDLRAPELLDADIAVVEISTVRRFSIGDTHLNSHRVFMAKRHGQYADLIAQMKTGSETESAEQLIGGLRDICKIPIMTVDHLYYLAEDNQPLAGRMAITELLSKLPFPFYSTRPVIERYGQVEALKDSGHYHMSFCLTVGSDMLNSIRRIAIH